MSSVTLAATGTNQYQCPSSQTTALVSTTLAALSATPATLAGLLTAAGQSTPLRFTLTLANGAPKTVQGKTTKITYSLPGWAVGDGRCQQISFGAIGPKCDCRGFYLSWGKVARASAGGKLQSDSGHAGTQWLQPTVPGDRLAVATAVHSNGGWSPSSSASGTSTST